VAHTPSHLLLIQGRNVVKVVIDILVPLVFVTAFKEIGIVDHFNSPGNDQRDGIAEQIEHKTVGDRVEPGGKDREVHFIAGFAALPVGHRHNPQHDVIVVRPCVIIDLVRLALHPPPHFRQDGIYD